jgi:hypothetical protein
VVLWVGGGIAIVLMALRLKSSGAQMADFARNIEWFGKFYFTPLSLISLVFGVLLVRQMDSVTVSDFFVQYGLTAVVITIAIGAGFLGPQSSKLSKLIEAQGAEAPEAQALLSRILPVARIDSAVLLSTVVVMALKPVS